MISSWVISVRLSGKRPLQNFMLILVIPYCVVLTKITQYYFFHGRLQANASPLLISFEAMWGDAQIGELSEYLKSNSCPFLQ